MFPDQILQFLLSGLTIGSIYALIALGFTIIYNTTGIINFAQGEFVMLGGMFMVAFTRLLHLPLPVGMLISIMAVMVVGVLIERLAIRPARHKSIVTLIIITIGVSIALKAGTAFFSKDSFTYQGKRNSKIKCRYARPFASSLLPGSIKDFIYHRDSVFILEGKNIPCYFNQITVEFTLVPFPEHSVHLIGVHIEKIPHYLVSFADKLHVSIFNTIMNHFHEMACTIFSHPVTAWSSAVNFRCNGLEYWFDFGPGSW